MSDYMPPYYREVREAEQLLDREAAELNGLNAAIRDVLNQLFVDTATWGLAHWERICGIPVDVAKPRNQRRSVIKSKLRGVGTVTVSLVKAVAEAYDNGEVDVTEDPANFSVTITFISNHGVPENLDDIRRALREIVPAHLAIHFEFTFMTYEALDSYSLTWADVDAKELTWADWETYKQ
ncbi:DUF2313 domain-containing protein [Xylanibacillus composti]|nr:DUF2313 domain-containing protein [Xylanibacillus composti]